MPVTVLLVIVGIIVVAVGCYAAGGRGGELSVEQPDYAPLEMGPVSATDVVLLRPPSGMWGYNMEATDEALERIAQSIRERDVRIVALEQLVTDLGQDPAPAQVRSSYVGARRLTDDLAATPAIDAGAAAGIGMSTRPDLPVPGSGPSPAATATSAAGAIAGAEADTAPQPSVGLADDPAPRPGVLPLAVTAPQLSLDPEVRPAAGAAATVPAWPVAKPASPAPPLPPGAVIKSSYPPKPQEAGQQDGGQQAHQQTPPPERSNG
jgi:hypothetical protein